MRRVLAVMAASLALVACGAPDQAQPPTVVAEEAPGQAVLDESLERYRELCRRDGQGSVCDRPVEIYATEFFRVVESTTWGRCDAEWKGTKLSLRILISDVALSWSSERLDLLVAHEAEHCLRGIAHDESGEPHLMRPHLLDESELLERSYENWVGESLEQRSSDPTKL
jgi:hypothetical protein